jgi:hypothetical protein
VALSSLLAGVVPAIAGNAPGKHTADYYLISPKEYEGKSISLDVAMVKPVLRASPLPGIQFFEARTFDQLNHNWGGSMLIAVLQADAKAFARKYGTTVDGIRRPNVLAARTNRLMGTLLIAGEARQAPLGGGKPRHQRPHPRPGLALFVDYEGKCQELIKAWRKDHQNKPLELPDVGRD